MLQNASYMFFFKKETKQSKTTTKKRKKSQWAGVEPETGIRRQESRRV